MSRTLLPAALIAAAVVTGGVSTTVSSHPAMYPKADKLAKFAEIHGFEHPSVAEVKQTPERPRLGIAISAISQPELDSMSLEYGVRIERVIPGSIAASISLEAGDVITALDDRPAYSPERLQHLVAATEGATTIALTRSGQALTLPIDFAPTAGSAMSGKSALGIRIQNMTTALKDAFGATGDNGVLVAEVNQGSAADNAGLKAGDVIVAIGDQTVQKTADVPRVLATHAPGEEVNVTILRNRSEKAVVVALDERERAMVPGKHHWMHGHGHQGLGKHGHGHPGHSGHGSRHGHYWPESSKTPPQQRPS